MNRADRRRARGWLDKFARGPVNAKATKHDSKRFPWWPKFVAEIEAIGGKVRCALIVHDEEDVELSIPEHRLEEAKAIMRRYWDPDGTNPPAPSVGFE